MRKGRKNTRKLAGQCNMMKPAQTFYSRNFLNLDTAFFGIVDGNPSVGSREFRADEVSNLILVPTADDVANGGTLGAAGLASERLSRLAGAGWR